MNRPDILLLSFLLIATISVVALAETECIYTLQVKTGTKQDAGTTSIIGVVIADKLGHYIEVTNLEKWGKMGPNYVYFKKGHLDIFSGKGRCFSSPACFLTLNSDGSGTDPSWYVDYVDLKVSHAGSESTHQHFYVEEWLAIDVPPFELSTDRNNCPLGSEIPKSLHPIV